MKAKRVWSTLLAVAAVAFLIGKAKEFDLVRASQDAFGKPSGDARLVSVEPLPTTEGKMCIWMPASASEEVMTGFRQQLLPQSITASNEQVRTSVVLDQPPIRTLRDTYPTYSAVALDPNTDEVYLQDENLFGYKVFNRLDNTPPTAAFTEPKRAVGGSKTSMDFNCALYVDPKTGDVYSISNDVQDTMSVFPRNAEGNVEPKHKLHTPHRTYGIAVNEEDQELILSIQHPPAVMTYRKLAEEYEAPLRILEGLHTELADPHGIAIDTKNQWLFVSNHGAFSLSPDGNYYSNYLPLSGQAESKGGPNSSAWAKELPFGRGKLDMALGSGKYQPPSITVYPLKASGDVVPLRVIQGPKTQLNWPAHLSIDPERGELFVANDMGDSVLVFSLTASGNAEPKRQLKGPKTRIKNPIGIYADLKNQELWVSNMGNHSATVYPLSADGDVAPLRMIRSAPLDKLEKGASMIGNPGGVAYDTKREEILVPN